MSILVRAAVVLAAAAALVAVPLMPIGCLGSLPEPTVCTSTVYAYCEPPDGGEGTEGEDAVAPPPEEDAGPQPGGEGGPGGPNPRPACNVTSNECLVNQRGNCACTSNAECTRGEATCYPPPDCPPAVKAVSAAAVCLEPRVGFGTSALPPRGGPGSSQGTTSACACGCASCSATCDGQGPVIGAGETLRVELDALGPSGRIGFMVRARGTGTVTANVRVSNGTPGASGTSTATGPGASFVDLLPANASGSTYTWTDDRLRPVAVELSMGPGALVEVDCVVPFTVP